METNPEYWIIVDGKKIKVWEMDLDDLIELEDEIMGEEGELDAIMKDYIHECKIIKFLLKILTIF